MYIPSGLYRVLSAACQQLTAPDDDKRTEDRDTGGQSARQTSHLLRTLSSLKCFIEKSADKPQQKHLVEVKVIVLKFVGLDISKKYINAR